MHDLSVVYRRAAAALVVVIGLVACGSTPPNAAGLLRQSSQRMLALKGFHFEMSIAGHRSSQVPVTSAKGEAKPPDLRADVNLQEGGLLLGLQVVFVNGGTYLKSFTGGWQKLSGQQLAQFFDPSALFDRQTGLFAAMQNTTAPYIGKTETVSGHDTYPIDGVVAASRIHQLLTPIVSQGSFHVTYWIESDNADLWRARLSGDLFDPEQASTVTFDFSNHDQPITVTPPPLG